MTEIVTTTDCGLRGLALLDAAIAHIEQHPETWDQLHYRCKTGMCVAGWTAELAGGRWATGPDEHGRVLLVADRDDRVWDAYPAEAFSVTGNFEVITAPSRAARLLGIDGDDCGTLFDDCNTLADIRRIRDELAAGGLS